MSKRLLDKALAIIGLTRSSKYEELRTETEAFVNEHFEPKGILVNGATGLNFNDTKLFITQSYSEMTGCRATRCTLWFAPWVTHSTVSYCEFNEPSESENIINGSVSNE